MLSSLYQPLIENPSFYRLFCVVLIGFIGAVLAYLVFLIQIPSLWNVFALCVIVGAIYCIYLYACSDQQVLDQATSWIVISNERFQSSSYGIQGDALVMLIMILPFVLLTWCLYWVLNILSKPTMHN